MMSYIDSIVPGTLFRFCEDIGERCPSQLWLLISYAEDKQTATVYGSFPNFNKRNFRVIRMYAHRGCCIEIMSGLSHVD